MGRRPIITKENLQKLSIGKDMHIWYLKARSMIHVINTADENIKHL